MQQKIVILDFGSQTTQLIGRRIRELDTFCEILPYDKFPADDASVIGVILSGSPYSVHDSARFKVDLKPFIGTDRHRRSELSGIEKNLLKLMISEKKYL